MKQNISGTVRLVHLSPSTNTILYICLQSQQLRRQGSQLFVNIGFLSYETDSVALLGEGRGTAPDDTIQGGDMRMKLIFVAEFRKRVSEGWKSPSIGVAKILSGGALFSSKKLTTFFSRRPQNMPPNLTRPAKNVLKIDSCSGWGCTSRPGGALTHFSCKLRTKNFFHRPGGAGAPTAPHGYACVPSGDGRSG